MINASLEKGDSPRGGEMSPQVTKGTAQYEVARSAVGIIPLSLRDIPLFKGDFLKKLISVHIYKNRL